MESSRESRNDANRIKRRDLPLLGLAMGLLAGVVHAGIVYFTHEVLGQIPLAGRDVAWMAPVAYVAIMLTVAIAAVILITVVQSSIWRKGAVFLLFLTGTFGIALHATAIHPWALLALAAGIATRLTMNVAASPIVWRRRITRSTTALVILALAFGGGSVATRAGRERRAMAGDSASPGSPNVLILILDTVRAANMGLYGYQRPTTPRLQQIASEGAVFEHSIAPAPWTLPSHASLFTGRWPSELNVSWQAALDDRDPTLAELLGQRGYATGGFVANVWYAAHYSGLARGFAHYQTYKRSIKQVFWSTTLMQVPLVRGAVTGRRFPTGWLNSRRWAWDPLSPNFDRKWAPEVTNEFLDWQASLDSRPFFAFLNYFDAHGEYGPPQSRTMFAAEPTEEDAYDGSIASIDAEIGRLIGELTTRGVLDNTIVVVTADHGEHFGEHGFAGHAKSLYIGELHVPLVIRFPARVPTGIRINQPVSLRDVGATIFDLLGATTDSFPGRSFADLMSISPNTTAPTTPVFAELKARSPWQVRKVRNTPAARGTMHAVFQNQWHLIINGDGVEELYDYWRDPEEQHNLAGSAEFAGILRELRNHRQSYP